MGRTVLVVAAHPDDEVLGCGGTLAKHAAEGDHVHVVILAEGVTSRDAQRNRAARTEELTGLAAATRRANAILGAHSVALHDLPDNRMDSLDRLEIVKLLEGHLATHQPDIVYTHHAGDVNIDHRRLHEAVITACRPIPGQSVRMLAFFEVASSTEWQAAGSAPAFVPQLFTDISATLQQKLAALDAYQTEMRPWPHARSIRAVEHLARWRGASVGCDAAEAFVLGRLLS